MLRGLRLDGLNLVHNQFLDSGDDIVKNIINLATINVNHISLNILI